MDNDLLNYINVHHAEKSRMISGKNTFTFISNQTGLPQAWTLDHDNKPVMFGEYPDRVLDVYHAPSGDLSVVSVDAKGNEKAQFFLQKEGESKQETLIHSPEHFHKFGGWSPDSKQICFSSNRRHPGYFDIFVQDVYTKELQKVFEFDGICEPICWRPDGQGILISIDVTNIENRMLVLDLNTRETTSIGQDQLLTTYSQPQFKQKGTTGYILTNENENTMYIGELDLDYPEEIQPLFHDEKWDIEEQSLSPDEKQIAFTINEGGYSRLAIWSIEEKSIFYLQGIPEGVISSLGWKNNHGLIFSVKTPCVPGDIWTYDLTDQTAKRMTYISDNPEIKDDLTTPSLCHYDTFDQEKIPYFLYDNGDHTNKPAVIFVHGGPESQIRPTYNPVVQYLQNKGFAVATPNVRGSKGYGRKYIKMDDRHKRMDAVKDLVWLTKDLQTSHSVNDKIGVIGRSYGGFMVLAALTHFPEIWSAGVNIVGISHFTSFLKNTGAWRRRLRESEYGSLEFDQAFFDEISPLYRTKDITAPLLVFHGQNDTRVPISEARQLVEGMKERHQAVEFTVFEDEGHQTEKVTNIIKMYADSIRFFEKHLKE